MTDRTSADPPDPRRLAPDRREALYRSLVDDAAELVVVVDAEFRMVLVAGAVEAVTGHRPADIEGRGLAGFLHPEDLERALKHMVGWATWGAPAGASSFRVRHADGRWVPIDVLGSEVTDGSELFLAVHGRPVDHQHAAEEVLANLLRGADRSAALRPVLDVFTWEANDARVAITWVEPDGRRRQVSTDLDPRLAGIGLDDGDDPWAEVLGRRTSVLVTDLDDLPSAVASAARDAGREAVWIVPVPDEGGEHPATVAVWSGVGRGRPDGHAFGMSLATTYVELILRWSSHVSRLTDAARLDPLTELPNRKALFEALEGDEDGGALLFCDLDHFKPVNDLHGHAAGDEVLRRVAERIAGCVRASDLVARTGGDEFVVLARGATTGQAAALAARIRTAVIEPIDLDGGTVAVGITIGVAHTPDPLSELTLAGADAALMVAKADDRGTVRWAQATSERPLTSTE